MLFIDRNGTQDLGVADVDLDQVRAVGEGKKRSLYVGEREGE